MNHLCTYVNGIQWYSEQLQILSKVRFEWAYEKDAAGISEFEGSFRAVAWGIRGFQVVSEASESYMGILRVFINVPWNFRGIGNVPRGPGLKRNTREFQEGSGALQRAWQGFRGFNGV